MMRTMESTQHSQCFDLEDLAAHQNGPRSLGTISVAELCTSTSVRAPTCIDDGFHHVWYDQTMDVYESTENHRAHS
jgi:hypothetical protein